MKKEKNISIHRGIHGCGWLTNFIFILFFEMFKQCHKSLHLNIFLRNPVKIK